MSDPPAPTFQTVRLARGHHGHPRDGVCAMELVSMLAGEPFSDRPETASPVIGALMRTYNDRAGRDRRQDLVRLAALVVDTRGDRALERRRADRCVEVATGVRDRLGRRHRWRRLPRAELNNDSLAWRTVGILRCAGDAGDAAVIALIEELAAMRPVAARASGGTRHGGREVGAVA